MTIPLDQIIGQRYGRLNVLDEASKSNTGLRRFRCRCSCGTETVVQLACLRKDHTRSCGCLQKEVAAAHNTTHGHRDHPLYGTWQAMLRRCTNPADKQYKDYAERGITVADRWLTLENYIEDIETLGPKPSPRHSIDRIDNNKGYYLENCRWALPVVQNNNQRPSKFAGRQLSSKNKSGVVGVFATPNGTWQARIQCNGKLINLGTFSTLQEAAAVREGAAAGLDYQRGRSEH